MQPKLKSAELLDDVIATFDAKDQNDLLVQRLLQKAKQLTTSSSADISTYSALVGLYALQQNPKKSRSAFKQAIQKFGEDIALFANYSVALNRLGYLQEAYEHSYHAYELDPSDKFLLKVLIDRCFNSGRIREAQKWLQRWIRFLLIQLLIKLRL